MTVVGCAVRKSALVDQDADIVGMEAEVTVVLARLGALSSVDLEGGPSNTMWTFPRYILLPLDRMIYVRGWRLTLGAFDKILRSAQSNDG